MKVALIIAIIVCTLISNFVYHKVFNVTYFGFKAIVCEWMVCIIVGFFLAGGIFRLLGLI